MAKMKRKKYEKELEKLQVELVRLQEWVKKTGARIVVLFEGRDAAGKGGVIKRVTARVSPRVFRVVALPAPTEREQSQLYMQRYIAHLPAAGEVVLFDRSWYNRLGVERGPWFVGGGFSMADINFLPFIDRLPAMEDGLMDKYPAIKSWHDAFRERKSYQDTLTDV